MADITDVVLIEVGEQGPAGQGVPTGGSVGQYLRKKTSGDFDTEWVDSSTTVPSLNDVGDVVITTPTDNQVLTYDSVTGTWINETIASGGGTWGSITGTLSNQTDLQSALDTKAASVHTHDDRYFTESEVTSLLAGKSDTSHLHTGVYATTAQGSLADSAVQPGDNVSDLTNDAGYLTSFTETDPVFTAWDKSTGISITESQISDLGSYEPANANIQSHISSTSNPHSTSAAQVGAYTTGQVDTLLSGKSNTSHNHAFANLTDVPSITGNAGKLFKVNPTEDGFVWGDPSGTTVSWGDIAGTLSDQTDLQSALNAKSDTTHNHTGVYEPANANIQSHIADSSLHFTQASITITESQISDLGDYATTSELTTGLASKSDTTHNHTGVYEPAFTKNTAFNKNFGTLTGTVCEGNDSRLSDARTPTAHTHVEADITDLGSYLTTETDPVFTAWDKSTGISITESQISDLGDYATNADLTTGLAGKSDTTHNHTGVYQPAAVSASNQTTDATPLVLQTITVNTGEQKIFEVRVRGSDASSSDSIWKKMTFGVKNVAGTASLIGGLDSAVGYDSAASGWSIVAGVSSGSVTITVTGEAGKTINWSSSTETY